MSSGLEVADVLRRHGEAYRRAHDVHAGKLLALASVEVSLFGELEAHNSFGEGV
jgi:hypothetical protein